MSDPVQNVEVEDVLSSIRRLVSEDKRPVTAPEVVPVAQDRLVLTPALRVMDDPETRDTDTQADISQDEEHASAPILSEAAFQDPTFKDQPMHAFEDAETSDLGASDIAGEAPLLLQGLEAPAPSEQDGPSLEQNDDVSIDPSETDGATDEPHGNDVDSVIDMAALVQVSAHKTHSLEEDPIADTAENEASIECEQTDYADDLHQSDGIVEAELMEPDEPQEQNTQADSLSAKIAALEAVIGGRDDDWDPDDTGDSDYSGTEAPAMAWDGQEPDTIDATATVTPETNDTADASDVLDEETLREMVSNIVREELQGALGERITRNVRKLVRREIHRAIAAQELE